MSKKARRYNRKTDHPQAHNSRGIIRKHMSPKSEPQESVLRLFNKNNLILNGSAGTGKTSYSIYLSLKYLEDHPDYKKIIFIRPTVQTRDMGFLKGGVSLSNGDGGKLEPFIAPYKSIVDDLCGKGAWDTRYGHMFEFMCTSFLRGTTFGTSKHDDNKEGVIVILDEMQNCNLHELDTIITRMGDHCKFIMCGDYYQSDLTKASEKNGILQFMDILKDVPYFKEVQFTHKDILRSDLVKQYIIAKEKYFS